MWVCSIYRPLTLWQVFSISSRNHKSPPRSAENGDVSSIRLNLSSIRVHFFKAPTLVNTMRGDGAGSSTSSRSVIDTPAQQRTPLFIHLAFSLEMIRRVKPDFFRIFFVLVLWCPLWRSISIEKVFEFSNSYCLLKPDFSGFFVLVLWCPPQRSINTKQYF